MLRTKDHAEVDVLTLVRDVFPSHQLLNLEQLCQVEVLLRCHDIDHLAVESLARRSHQG